MSVSTVEEKKEGEITERERKREVVWRERGLASSV